MRYKNILDINDFTPTELEHLIERAHFFKKNWNDNFDILKNKRVGMLFDSSSLRTKVSFEVAVQKLGGISYFVDLNEVITEAGAPRESYEDIVDTLDRFVDIYVVRDYSRKILDVLKRAAFPPLINAFSVVGHPSQALADVAVIQEKRGDIKKLNITAVCKETGSGVIESFAYAIALLGGHLTLITPTGTFTGKNSDFIEVMRTFNGTYSVTSNVPETMAQADILYVDEWWFPGAKFLETPPPKGYVVDQEFLSGAKADLGILHCLPAHRGREVSGEVLDSNNSYIFDEAEYRLYSAMALLEYLAEGTDKEKPLFSKLVR